MTEKISEEIIGDKAVMLETLTCISKLDKISEWGFKKISPYIGKRVLEAGCGNGNLTEHMKDREVVVAVDYDDDMLLALKKRFIEFDNIKIVKERLECLRVDEISKNNIDTIVCINTLEHIKDDISVLKNFYSVLGNGKLILLVPSFQSLFCPLDDIAGHFRRYNMDELIKKVESCGFMITKSMYFNFFGLLGWFFNGKILKKNILSTRLLGLFNLLIPLFDLFEKITGPPIGISIILVCEKKSK